MAPKIAIVYYSMYGHIAKLATSIKEGVESAGGSADLFQVPETLPQEVLGKMHAPAKDSSVKTLDNPEDLKNYDAFLLGIPTRYGNFPAQWKAFWDKTGGIWASGGYFGKYAGLFVSSGSQGGGQESTAIAAMSTLAHHGIIYVPLGYTTTFSLLSDVSEVRGGSAWGSGTFAGADGSRQPSAKELELAKQHGVQFFNAVNRVNFATSSSSSSAPTAADTSKPTAAPAAPAATTATTAPKVDGEQEPREQKSKDGFCGLPFKCSIQ